MVSLEHSKAGYWTDYLLYALVICGLALTLSVLAPRHGWPVMVLLAALGLAAWSLAEYLMHRFVLHGLQPFKSWHARHHDRPAALISAPTVLSASLITVLVFVPAVIVGSLWPALSLTLGFTVGYFAYALCHHATHHWRANRCWFKERKRWHSIHHRRGGAECYGVTSNFWDRVFGTGPKR